VLVDPELVSVTKGLNTGALATDESVATLVATPDSAWDTCANAAASIVQSAVLTINGDTSFAGQPDTIRLIRNANNPLLLDAFLNNSTATADLSVPMTSVTQIVVNGLGGDDSLTVDLSNGNALPPGGITYTGGTGSNSLIVNGTINADTMTLGNTLSVPGGVISYSGVSSINLQGSDGNDTLVDTGSDTYAATQTFNERFGMVTGITYMPGYAMFRGAGKRIDVSTASHLLTAATGARYWLLPPARMLSWEVHTGFGVGFGGLPAYEDLFVSSTVTGILGTAVRYQIARNVSLHLQSREHLIDRRPRDSHLRELRELLAVVKHAERGLAGGGTGPLARLAAETRRDSGL
jgi:hypothetical protein